MQPNTSNPYRRRFPQRTNSYAFRFRGSGQDGEIIRDDLRAWSTKLHLHAPPNLYPRIKVPYRTIFMVSLINLFITFFIEHIILHSRIIYDLLRNSRSIYSLDRTFKVKEKRWKLGTETIWKVYIRIYFVYTRKLSHCRCIISMFEIWWI